MSDSPAGLPPELDAALVAVTRRRPLLVASDYDGVLARLRDDPSAAVPEPGVAETLARLVGHDGVEVALVSGRGVEDLRTTSGLSGPFHWVGSHGAEFDGPPAPELTARRDALVDALRPLVDATPAARLEVKPASVAVHVRQVVDRSAAADLLAQVQGLADSSLTMKPGKEVLELAITDADKGTALRRLRRTLGAAGTVYLGDDVTDEDGFRALEADDVPVKIGDGPTEARYRVTDLVMALAVLDRLAELTA